MQLWLEFLKNYSKPFDSEDLHDYTWDHGLSDSFDSTPWLPQSAWDMSRSWDATWWCSSCWLLLLLFVLRPFFYSNLEIPVSPQLALLLLLCCPKFENLCLQLLSVVFAKLLTVFSPWPLGHGRPLAPLSVPGRKGGSARKKKRKTKKGRKKERNKTKQQNKQRTPTKNQTSSR